jgi:hypothetical protein
MRKKIINKLASFGKWLSDDNGMEFKKFINYVLKDHVTKEDVNHKYQVPLKILYDMGVGSGTRQINRIKDVYTLERLNNSGLIFDVDGNWMPINKLNTNYYALSELIVSVLEKEGKLEGFSKFVEEKTDEEIMGFLKEKNSYFFKKVMEYFKEISDYDSVLGSIKRTSAIGEKTENEVREILEKSGFSTKYQGGDGDLIDMIFGIDLIMEKKGKMYLIQIKTNPKHIDVTNGYYKDITLFVNPTNDGIRIVERSGKEHFLDRNGKLIK